MGGGPPLLPIHKTRKSKTLSLPHFSWCSRSGATKKESRMLRAVAAVRARIPRVGGCRSVARVVTTHRFGTTLVFGQLEHHSTVSRPTVQRCSIQIPRTIHDYTDWSCPNRIVGGETIDHRLNP